MLARPARLRQGGVVAPPDMHRVESSADEPTFEATTGGCDSYEKGSGAPSWLTSGAS